MKITKKKTHCMPIEFNSANDIIKVKLDMSNGPEIELADTSIILFPDVDMYYRIIGGNDDEVKLFDLNRYLVISDDVAEITYENRTVYGVDQFKYNGKSFYRFIM